MANLQIKGINDDLYNQIKQLAVSENRSVSQEVLYLIKLYLSNKDSFEKLKTPAQTLLDLCGSWEDNRSADTIVQDIRSSRKNSNKYREGF